MAQKHRQDWLPEQHLKLHTFLNNVWDCLLDNETRTRFCLGDGNMENTPAHWLNHVFKPKLDEYNAVYIEWADPGLCTQVVRVKFFRIEAEIKPLFRQLYMGFIKNNMFVLDEDLEIMGFPRRVKSRKSPSIPEGVPEMEVNRRTRLVWLISFHDMGSRHRGCPADAASIEIRHAITQLKDARPGASELSDSAYETVSPVKMTFNNEDEGKMCHFAGRWLNSHGHPGDWSMIYSFVIS